MSLLTNYSSHYDIDVNNAWYGDRWASQYGRNDQDKVSTSVITSASKEMMTGCRIFPSTKKKKYLRANLFLPGDVLCSKNTFNCTNKVPACIPNSWVCDGHNECSDGSDENKGMCSKCLYCVI